MAVYKSFYFHGITRRYIIAFGDIFSNIQVVRYSANGIEANRVDVPIEYGPKEKFFVRTTQDPDFVERAAISLPRMSYEIVGMNYSSERKQPNNLRLRDPPTYTASVAPSNNLLSPTVYLPVPYDLTINLYLATKSADEAFQVAEQIIPMFTPDKVVNVKVVPDMNANVDVPITLSSTSIDDQHDGSFNDRRQIMWTFTFVLKGFYYGPVTQSRLITSVEANVISPTNQIINKIEVDQTDINIAPGIYTHAELIAARNRAIEDYGFSGTIT